MTWNPIRSDRELKGADRLRKPTPASGEIIVLYGSSGKAMVLEPGHSPTSGEMRVQRPSRLVTISSTPEPLELTMNMPANNSVESFDLHITLRSEVSREFAPTAAARFSAVAADPASLVETKIKAIASPLLSRADVRERANAEEQVRAALKEGLDLSDLGLECKDLAVGVGLPKDLVDEIKGEKAAERDRKRQEEEATAKRETERRDVEAELERDHLRSKAAIENQSATFAVDLNQTEAEEKLRIQLEKQAASSALEIKQLEAKAASEMGPLNEDELIRLFMLQNPDAAREMLAARGAALAQSQNEQRKLLEKLIDNGLVDIRTPEGREIVQQLSGSHYASISPSEKPGLETTESESVTQENVRSNPTDPAAEPNGG